MSTWTEEEPPDLEDASSTSSSNKKDCRGDEEEPHSSSSASPSCIVRRQLPSPNSNSTATDYYCGPPIASCRAETILLSSAGDVLSIRCRNGPYAESCCVENINKGNYYQWNLNDNDMAKVLCCENDCDDLSTQLQQSGGAVCNGLLGGAPSPTGVVAPLQQQQHEQNMYTSTAETIKNRAQKAFRSQPLDTTAAGCLGDEESGIFTIKSFDYSQFYEGGNDMVPKTTEHNAEKENMKNTGFVHGVPTFLASFTNIKITTVSAHPLGNHVLLISNAGLLYSYGLNDFGQLGIGIRTDSSNSIHRGYILQPTIVTPLVENGGKAIRIAAGTNHSLVVVETEERRLIKSRSFDYQQQQQQSAAVVANKPLQQYSKKPQCGTLVSRSQSETNTEAIVHHQMYGFGCNDFMKIGLVRHTAENCVVLPRRVALGCSARPYSCYDGQSWHSNNSIAASDQQQLPQGIFAVEASAEHSAALVRRANGDVELFTWGNAMYSCLGLPTKPATTPMVASNAEHQQAVRVVPVPSFVASLSRTSNPDARTSSLLLHEEGEHPVDISLGRRCSFVVTSIGRCFSFGMSEEGMLGLGRTVYEADQPTEIAMPQDARQESIVSVSAGGGHVVVCTKSGNAYGWGARCHAGIGDPAADKPAVAKPKNESPSNENTVEIEWSPKRIVIPHGCSKSGSNSQQSIVQACAGSDCSFFVAESGNVYSTGKNSGRLGLGEISEDIVNCPKPLFGGLHLWKKDNNNNNKRSEPLSVKKDKRAVLNRGVTMRL